MLKKGILLAAADSVTLTDFQSNLGDAWDVTTAANSTEALAELERESFDVVVVDLTLAELDGLELLNRIQLMHPKTLRFILAPEAERERVMKKALGAHQFLGKPLEPGSLSRTFARALALESWIPRNSIRELVARVRTLPTIPSLYLEVQTLLKSPDATTEEVGAIIGKDMSMMTKLLQVLNSAAFALQRRITNPTEAVGILGFETVSSMVMAIKVLGEYDKVKPVYFSIDRLWKHSTAVARNAKELTLMHTNDRALAELAFTGGLMHDLGKVVLAANFDEQYRGAQSLARKQQLPLWEVEKEIFGATHGEIGAYLLGLWGMPLEILEVAALHHHPIRSECGGFTALTAVHVANAFEYEANPDKDGAVASKIDEAYLARIGVLEHLAQWRTAVTTRNFAKTASKPKAVMALAVPQPLPKKQTPAASQKPISVSLFRKQWFYPGIGAAAALLLLGWLSCEFLFQKTNDGLGAKSVTAAQHVLASLSPVQEVRARTDQSPSAPTLPQPASAISKTESPKDAAVRPHLTVPAQTPEVAHYKTNFADLKLQGIFFSASHPRAMINGKTVQAGDRIGEVVVLSVDESSATIGYQKQIKVLTLK